jgi:hypothetical protein
MCGVVARMRERERMCVREQRSKRQEQSDKSLHAPPWPWTKSFANAPFAPPIAAAHPLPLSPLLALRCCNTRTLHRVSTHYRPSLPCACADPLQPLCPSVLLCASFAALPSLLSSLRTAMSKRKDLAAPASSSSSSALPPVAHHSQRPRLEDAPSSSSSFTAHREGEIKEEEEEEEVNEKEYEVERIVGQRGEGKNLEFCVKWLYYPEW